MSFFDDFLTTAAPIAAGAMFGPGGAALAAGSAGTAIAAGAATGAGIAALSGDDPLMGAISGGMGGYGGAGIGQAMSTTALPAGTQTTANIMGPNSGIAFNPTAGTVVPNPTLGEGFKASMNDPKAFLSNLGGGTRFDGNKMITESEAAKKGAIKLGAVGLPAIGQALVPDYNANPDDDPMSKYDPKRRLNVNMPTGIQNAMTRDSGLRLNQPFAQFAQGGYLEDYLYSDPVRRDQFGEMLEGIKSIPQNVREGTQFYLDQYREKKQNEAAEQQFRDDYPELQREIDTGRTAEEELQLRNFFRNNMAQGGYLETGMGDGMSDDIPSSIDGAQPAALSENEFVIPADVVSHLGNGSSDAGAEQLYAMMDRVRKARTGNEEQGRDIMPQEYMPA